MIELIEGIIVALAAPYQYAIEISRKSAWSIGYKIYDFDKNGLYFLSSALKTWDSESCTPVTDSNVIDRINSSLHNKGLHYSSSRQALIHWFNIGDRVLGRQGDNNTWQLSMFERYTKSELPYCCIAEYQFRQCIPLKDKERPACILVKI